MAARIDGQALAASLRRVSARPDPSALRDSLRRVVQACSRLFDVTGGGLMLADEHGDLRYVVAADPVSQLLEDAQIETGEGPCVDTYVRDEVVASDDLRADRRWPDLAARLSGTSIGAVLGVPVHLSGIEVGSLDVFVDSDHRWHGSEQRALTRYGEVTEAMLTVAVSAEQAGELAVQLNYALEYRAPIERAVGYLMARDGLVQAHAFSRLREVARSNRTKISVIAVELLDTGRLRGEPR